MEANGIGHRVETLRKRAGLSRGELAGLAKLHASHVGLIESGKRKDPATSTLGAIASVLGTSIEHLASGAGPEPSARALARAVEKARGSHAA